MKTTYFYLSQVLWIAWYATFCLAQDNVGTPEEDEESRDCSSADNCLSCLSLGCSWGTDGICGCDRASLGADEACYGLWAVSSGGFITPNGTTVGGSSYFATPESVCGGLEQSEQNMETCKQVTDCLTCVETTIVSNDANSASTCSWYQDRGYCSSLYSDGEGESSAYCPGTPEGNCYYVREAGCASCISTVSNGTDRCVWLGDYCSSWCFYSEDKYCFSFELYPSSSVEEICQSSVQFYADQALCDSGGTDCANCTSNIRSDGTPCFFFDYGDGTGYCSIGCDDDPDGYTTTCLDDVPVDEEEEGTLPVLDLNSPPTVAPSGLALLPETENGTPDEEDNEEEEGLSADTPDSVSSSGYPSFRLEAIFLSAFVSYPLVIAILL